MLFRAVAAPLISAFIVVAVCIFLLHYSNSSHEVVHATGVGEQKRFTLPDGTRVHLDTASRLTYSKTSTHRVVRLSGRARFEPASDPSRQFTVFAGGSAIRDIGTIFDVYARKRGDVEVLVTEGTVLLSPQTRQPPMRRLLQGERLGYLNGGRSVPDGSLATWKEGALDVQPLPPAEIQRRGEWVDGKLGFHETPLAEALEEVSRYHRRRLVIADPEIGATKIDAHFYAHDLSGFLAALEFTANIRHVSRGGGDAAAIELHRAEEQKTPAN